MIEAIRKSFAEHLLAWQQTAIHFSLWIDSTVDIAKAKAQFFANRRWNAA
jgi:hypothetical protein